MQHRDSRGDLRDFFDFTVAEAKLIKALCAGDTLGNFAEINGTSLKTVKTHLKHVFDKTGETRQADLVRRVMNDLALRLGKEPQGRGNAASRTSPRSLVDLGTNPGRVRCNAAPCGGHT